MRKPIITLLVALILFYPLPQVIAGSSDTWKSCCSSGCDYSPSCSPVSFSFGTYYCCNSGWNSSLCSECSETTTTSTTTSTTSSTTTTTSTTTSTTTTSSTTTTTTTPSCSGSISLSLSPNPTSPSSTVTANADNLSNCNGKTIYIKDYTGCASGVTICSCTSSSTGCSCTFTAPSSPGQYGYYACIDKNGDGDFADPGEQSDKAILNVASSTTSTTSTTSSTTTTTSILHLQQPHQHQQPQVAQPPPQPLFHLALVTNVAYIRLQTAIINAMNGKIAFNLLVQQADV